MTATLGSNQLLAFIKFLRGRNIPVSPADTLDAVQAASLLGYEQRDTLRDGLAAVLAKSSHEELTYREAFDLFFQPAKNEAQRTSAQEDASAAQESPDSGEVVAGQQDAVGDSLEDLLQGASGGMDPALSELAASSLMQALQGGDEAALSL